jgi:hypothetical protein
MYIRHIYKILPSFLPSVRPSFLPSDYDHHRHRQHYQPHHYHHYYHHHNDNIIIIIIIIITCSNRPMTCQALEDAAGVASRLGFSLGTAPWDGLCLPFSILHCLSNHERAHALQFELGDQSDCVKLHRALHRWMFRSVGVRVNMFPGCGHSLSLAIITWRRDYSLALQTHAIPPNLRDLPEFFPLLPLLYDRLGSSTDKGCIDLLVSDGVIDDASGFDMYINKLVDLMLVASVDVGPAPFNWTGGSDSEIITFHTHSTRFQTVCNSGREPRMLPEDGMFPYNSGWGDYLCYWYAQFLGLSVHIIVATHTPAVHVFSADYERHLPLALIWINHGNGHLVPALAKDNLALSLSTLPQLLRDFFK